MQNSVGFDISLIAFGYIFLGTLEPMLHTNPWFNEDLSNATSGTVWLYDNTVWELKKSKWTQVDYYPVPLWLLELLEAV